MAPKEVDSKLLQTHITGVLTHGTQTFSIVDIMQYPHDSNLTLNCLLGTLVQTARDHRLTPTIYIQLDNCGRENKNKYFLACVALLVKTGLVSEVVVSFLMVGHTHEDIDAKFSRISVALRGKDAKTIPEMMEVIQASTTSSMVPQLINTVFNIRDWLAPCIEEIHNHQYPHVYRMWIDRPNHVANSYKNWSTDNAWQQTSASGEPLEIFKLDEDGNQKIPTGVPDIVSPDYERKNNMENVKQNIERIRGFLTFAQHQWWQRFLADPSVDSQPECRWYLDELRPQLHHEQPDEAGEQPFSPLQLALEKERNTRPVYTGKKRAQSKQKQSTPTKKPVGEGMGYMIAVRVDEDVCIGKISAVGRTTVEITMFGGSLQGEWAPLKSQQGKFYTRTIPKADMKDDMFFYLTRAGHLPAHIKGKINGIV